MVVAPPPPADDLDDAGAAHSVLGKRPAEAPRDAASTGDGMLERPLVKAIDAAGKQGCQAAENVPAFPASRVRELLHERGYAAEVCDGAAVYLSAVLEQITGRLIGSAGVETQGDSEELSRALGMAMHGTGESGRGAKKRNIVPKAIQRALTKDVAMQRCLAGLAAMDCGAEASEWLVGKSVCIDCNDSSLLERHFEAVRVTLLRMGILPMQAPGQADAMRGSLHSLSQHQVSNPTLVSLLLQSSTREKWVERAKVDMMQQEARRLQTELRHQRRLNAAGDSEEEEEEEEEEETEIEEHETRQRLEIDEDDHGGEEQGTRSGVMEAARSQEGAKAKEVGAGRRAAGGQAKARAQVKAETEEEEEEGSGPDSDESEEEPYVPEPRAAAVTLGSVVTDVARAIFHCWAHHDLTYDELALFLDLKCGGECGSEGGGEGYTMFLVARGGVAGWEREMWDDAVVVALLRCASVAGKRLLVVDAQAGARQSDKENDQEEGDELVDALRMHMLTESAGDMGRIKSPVQAVRVQANLQRFPKPLAIVQVIEHAQGTGTETDACQNERKGNGRERSCVRACVHMCVCVCVCCVYVVVWGGGGPQRA